jgi:hypothetical protein
MEEIDIEKEINDNIRLLTQGLMQSDKTTTYKSYKNLYKIGSPVLRPLKKKLLAINWSQKNYKELTRYVAGIFALIRDIDEDEANQVRKTLLSTGCPEHISVLLESLCSFSLKDFLHYQVCSIDIYEHKTIQKKCKIQTYLQKWLSSIPENDLFDISRLYIVGKDDIVNASGKYMPVLFTITIEWNNPYKEHSLLFNFFSLFTEKTLYHEIGHHVSRHAFGHNPDHEKEADIYAYKYMRKNHRYLAKLLKILPRLGKKSKNYYRQGL